MKNENEIRKRLKEVRKLIRRWSTPDYEARTIYISWENCLEWVLKDELE